MKYFLLACAIFVAVPAFAQDQASPEEIGAYCNLQIGQSLVGLGQAQQENIKLKAKISDLEKQIADLKGGSPSQGKPPQNNIK